MVTANPLTFDPVLAAIDRAPRGEPLSDEQHAQLDRQMEHVRAGRVKMIPHAVVMARLEARRVQLEAIQERLRARGLDAEILWEGTPDDIQAYCDAVLGGDPAVVILGSERDEVFMAERRAYEAATGERLVLDPG
jgi:hypothetical protein